MDISSDDSDEVADDLALLSTALLTSTVRPRPVSPDSLLPRVNAESPSKRLRPSSSRSGPVAPISGPAAARTAPAESVTVAVSTRSCDRCGCVGSAESGSAEARSRGAGFLGNTTACRFGHTGAVQLKGINQVALAHLCVSR